MESPLGSLECIAQLHLLNAALGHISECIASARCACSEDPLDGLGKLRVEDMRKLLVLYREQAEMLGKDNAFYKVPGRHIASVAHRRPHSTRNAACRASQPRATAHPYFRITEASLSLQATNRELKRRLRREQEALDALRNEAESGALLSDSLRASNRALAAEVARARNELRASMRASRAAPGTPVRDVGAMGQGAGTPPRQASASRASQRAGSDALYGEGPCEPGLRSFVPSMPGKFGRSAHAFAA